MVLIHDSSRTLRLALLFEIGFFAAIFLGSADGSEPKVVRVATFNVALAAERSGELARRLANPDDPQAQAVAEIIQRVRPDVLLLNEFDFDAEGTALSHFQRNYLAQPQNVTRQTADPA